MKKLIALAVAGAFIAPAAMAESKNVELYGIAQAGFVNEKNAGGNTESVNKIEDFGSRIGLKGSEDLGGGLSAIWKIESKVALDNGSQAGFATREGHVGLKGGFGTVLAGRGKSPYQLATEEFDPFNSNDTLDITGFGVTGGRVNNAVVYMTPDLSGLTISAAYAFGENKTATTEETNAISLSAKYAMGTLAVIAAVEQVKNDAGVKDAKKDGLLIGATYSMGPLGVAAAYQMAKAEKVAAIAAGEEAKANTLLLNATYEAGAVVAKAGLMMKGKDKVAGNDVDDSEVTKFILGADYNLSKRTLAFAEFAKTDYKDSKKDDPQTISVGLIHKF